MRKLYKQLNCALIMAMPSLTHAATIETVLNKAVHLIQGPIAKSIAILVISYIGYECLFTQRFPKSKLITSLLGIGIIFGASTIYSHLV